MIKKILLAALLCAAWERAGSCAPSFTQEAGLNLASATLRCVLPVSGGYRMYFSTPPAFSVFSATSTDGITWGVEAGVRLSTPLAGSYSSSITALGAYSGPAITSGPYRAYYVGLSSTGLYSILSATSTDGLSWGLDSDFLMRFNGGANRVLSLAPYFLGSGKAVLYYVRDSGGAPNPASYRVYAATSSDGGNSFSGETQVLSSNGVFNVAVSSLTDGTIRLFAAAALSGGTTASQVLSADSADGAVFGAAGQVFSTNPATNVLGGIAVTRSTDTYRWRMHMNLKLWGSATDYVLSALTLTPALYSFSPARVYNDDPATDFTLTGEIFSTTAPVVTINQGSTLIANAVTRISDMRLIVNATPAGAPIGSYSVTVTNPDGRSAVLANTLLVDFKPGFVAMTDNLFRPLKNEKARIAATIFYPGAIAIKIYDINGGLVRRLGGTAANVSPATNTFLWDGKTDSGAMAASGLYLLRLKGPKIDAKEKIVLIK